MRGECKARSVEPHSTSYRILIAMSPNHVHMHAQGGNRKMTNAVAQDIKLRAWFVGNGLGGDEVGLEAGGVGV